MKFILFSGALIFLFACTEFSNKHIESESTQPALIPSKGKKTSVLKNKKNDGKEISGTLLNGTLYEALQDTEGYVVSFDPYLPKDDHLFMKAASQIIARIYRDHIKNEARISIQTDIGYTIVEGKRARYKIVPFKETSGDISTLSITVI